MNRWWVASIGLVLLLGRPVEARQRGGDGSYTVSGFIVSQHETYDSQFEIRLLTDSNRELAVLVKRIQEPFTFSGLERGVYYIVANIFGYKPVRQRLDFVGGQREANVPIILEADPVVLTKATGSLLDENLVTSVSRMAQPAALLKELDAANKKLLEGRTDESRSRLESIVFQAPDFYDAHRSLAMAYQSSRLFREAEKEYRIAQKLNPTLPGPWLGLASIYLEQAEADVDPSVRRDSVRAALEASLQAIKLDPGVAFGHYLLGVAYYKSSLLDKAETSLIHSLELDPALGMAHLALVNVYVRVQDWGRALGQIDSYIKENPRAPDRDQMLAKRSEIERLLAG